MNTVTRVTLWALAYLINAIVQMIIIYGALYLFFKWVLS